MSIKASNQITIVDVTDAYSALLSSEGYTFVGDSTGAPSGLTCTTQVTAYRGSHQCEEVRVMAVQCPSGISAIINDNGTSSPVITFTTIDIITEAAQAIIHIVVDEIIITKIFTFSVAIQGSDGADGKGIKATEITYQIGESGTVPPEGTWTNTIPETTSEKPYLWTCTVITYTDDTTSTSYSVSSTLDSVDIGGRNLVSEYDFTLSTSGNEVSYTDDGKGNVAIINRNEGAITDDGNGNVAVVDSTGMGITDDNNGNVTIAIASSGSETETTGDVTHKYFIVDSGDATDGNEVSYTDDGKGNVAIINRNEGAITDDGNGNVAVVDSTGMGITDDNNGNVTIAIASSGSETETTGDVTHKYFIVDSGDATDLTVAVNSAYDASMPSRTGVYTISAYNVGADNTIGTILTAENERNIDSKRYRCTMNISKKSNKLVAVKIAMSSTDANEKGIKINFSYLKIEKGNQETDFTHSPEDTDNAISGIRDSMTIQKAEIISDCKSIILSALETYVESGEYDEFKQTVSSQLELLADRITMTFSTVSQQVTDVDGDMQTKFNELYKYITFSGENAITIGSSDSSIKLILDNDQILFTKDDATFGSWDGNNFHTGNIVVDVNERAQFGNFAFLPNSDGSLSFVKVGG